MHFSCIGRQQVSSSIAFICNISGKKCSFVLIKASWDAMQNLLRRAILARLILLLFLFIYYLFVYLFSQTVCLGFFEHNQQTHTMMMCSLALVRWGKNVMKCSLVV